MGHLREYVEKFGDKGKVVFQILIHTHTHKSKSNVNYAQFM